MYGNFLKCSVLAISQNLQFCMAQSSFVLIFIHEIIIDTKLCDERMIFFKSKLHYPLADLVIKNQSPKVLESKNGH